MHPFLYPLKTLENLPVFCFQGVEKGFMGNKWVNGGKEKFLVALFWRWCGEFDDLNADEDDILGLFQRQPSKIDLQEYCFDMVKVLWWDNLV